MGWQKRIADVLTATRIALACYLVWLGLTQGAAALPTAITVLILCWATDLLDGPLARRDPAHTRTWLGEHDLAADMSVALAVLGFLTLSRFVAPPVTAIYLLVSVGLLWHYRAPVLGMALQAPPYGGMLWVALRQAFLYGLLAIGWIVLTVIVTWPRFPRQVVPNFLADMRSLARPDEQAKHVNKHEQRG
ncbi:MAG TPA: CDP-alcohol phosphatidyltransferase family protein [Anaerolineae bacterium]|nr:CDP-alcohol phosphatidyltransferase family protein [Anaerolineae bacterium]HIQ06660.1 CDP-alcohol phosphatidyltransferase family protein [Anaerolineae bacterium]